MQLNLIGKNASLNISSYDLFIVHRGIECAMFPHLYPCTKFTDTGILEHYKHEYGDDTNRVCSIGISWTRKVLSSVRVYGEQRDLPFFLYETHLAQKYFQAHVRAKRLGVTADVLTRDSQTSTGYWDIVQDSLADLVRIMLRRCYDQENYPELYHHCRDLRGEVSCLAPYGSLVCFLFRSFSFWMSNDVSCPRHVIVSKHTVVCTRSVSKHIVSSSSM